jgi:hypothetical protein
MSPLSRDELNRLTRESVDPKGLSGTGRISPAGTIENVDLTDEQLVQTIEKRNKARQPTYKLRFEYERRLRQRGL